MDFQIQPMQTIAEAKECAALMSSSAPWITLNRSYEDSLRLLLDSTNEVFILRSAQSMTGFAVVSVCGSCTPYIRSVAILPACRNQGAGTALIRLIEEKYSIEHSRIFISVSSFNENAKKLYVSLGYAVIGELGDLIIKGHSEWLLWKPLKAKPTPETDGLPSIPYISTRKDLMNVEYIFEQLKNSYWAKNITKEEVMGRIANSLSFGLFKRDRQIGFARVITDYNSIAYIADVFIEERERGNGYSRVLLDHILNYPKLNGVKWLLATRDAHGLYEKFGFSAVANPERFMGKDGWSPF